MRATVVWEGPTPVCRYHERARGRVVVRHSVPGRTAPEVCFEIGELDATGLTSWRDTLSEREAGEVAEAAFIDMAAKSWEAK